MLLRKLPKLRSCALAVAVSWISLTVGATPLTQLEIVSLCGNAEDAAHCGRLIEEVQLKRLPNLARRDGAQLLVSLYPSGSATFTDSDDPALIGLTWEPGAAYVLSGRCSSQHLSEAISGLMRPPSSFR